MLAHSTLGGVAEMSAVGRIEINGEETLGHVLKDRRLSMPINQREYAWTTDKHVPDLLGDLANAIANKQPEYFLGSVVVTKLQQGRHLVIDGQQRLATTTILLSAIRDYFLSAADQARAQFIEERYLFDIDGRTLETSPRLILNRIDNEYFRRRILSRPGTPERMGATATAESHDLIDAAASLIAKRVKAIAVQFNEPHRTERLMDWVDYCLTGARIIWVEVPDETNGFVMFQTLNDRGLALSKADLIKNLVYNLAMSDRLPEVQQRWDAMMGALDTLKEDDIVITYLRHLWSSMRGPTREKRLYADVQAGLTSKQAAVDFADDLATHAPLYAALLNPHHHIWSGYDPRTPNHVETLHSLGVAQARPLLLAIVKHFSPKDVTASFGLLVSVAVRLLIVGGGGAGTMETNYSKWARAVRAGSVSSAAALLKEIGSDVPNDSEFEGAFAIARVSKALLARYYLCALERFTLKDPQPEFVPNTNQWEVDLEHVVPKSGIEIGWDGLTAEEARALCRRIGNLALLRRTGNSLVGNEPFAVKQPVLGASDFTLTSQIAQNTKWGADEVTARQAALAALAVKTWPLKII